MLVVSAAFHIIVTISRHHSSGAGQQQKLTVDYSIDFIGLRATDMVRRHQPENYKQ